MQVKLREIQRGKIQVQYGFTVPQEIAMFFKECYFFIEKSGTSIVFTSGASLQPTKEEIKNFNFEGIKI
jgi:hypothetical protein